MKAYTKLGTVIKFRDGIIENGTFPLYRNGTLKVPDEYPMIWNVISKFMINNFPNAQI
jgi:hypothetical protein